jgi:SAM-dependent methyltransferase
MDYLSKNRELWNLRTTYHLKSEFYDIEGFKKGNSSLNEIELALLGDIRGKKVLHLQCHFGQDTLSLARMGAKVTGIDLSDKAIEEAQKLAKELDLEATFICCDLYDSPQFLKNQQFDLIFTSYGVIGWLPDLNPWAKIIANFLSPKGKFILVEFHPLVWMYDNDFEKIAYSYFKESPIVELEIGTYADTSAPIQLESVTWNHSLGEVIGSLLKENLKVVDFQEYDYSPYNCFKHTKQLADKKFIIQPLGQKAPLVYSVMVEKG